MYHMKMGAGKLGGRKVVAITSFSLVWLYRENKLQRGRNFFDVEVGLVLVCLPDAVEFRFRI